jgi:hypothetical protein
MNVYSDVVVSGVAGVLGIASLVMVSLMTSWTEEGITYRLDKLSEEINGLKNTLMKDILDVLQEQTVDGDSTSVTTEEPDTVTAFFHSFMFENGSSIYVIIRSQSVSSRYTILDNDMKVILQTNRIIGTDLSASDTCYIIYSDNGCGPSTEIIASDVSVPRYNELKKFLASLS